MLRTHSSRLRTMCCASFAALLLATPARATWPSDPAVNLPVCRASLTQMTPTIIASGSGGVYIAWMDFREQGNTGFWDAADIYLQRLTAGGTIAPGWPVDGLAVCAAAHGQWFPTLVSDAEGGVYVVWEDHRVFGADVYIQRVTRDGAIAEGWPAAGLAVCALSFDQNRPVAVADGAGGVIIAWDDMRDTYASDIFAQRITTAGAVAPGWPANGVPLCSTSTPRCEELPAIASDYAGGAIVAWNVRDNLTPLGMRLQHVTASGAIAMGWPEDGLQLSSHSDVFTRPLLATVYNPPDLDGVSGAFAFVAWSDRSSGSADLFFNGAPISFTGMPSTLSGEAIPICTAPDDQVDPSMALDGLGGVLVAWADNRDAAGTAGSDIYAQRLNQQGGVSIGWPVDGARICGAAIWQGNPDVVPDGAGGAIVTWTDGRAGVDVYAQHVSVAGSVDAAWPVDGRAVTQASFAQQAPRAVADGAGGATIVWDDSRPSPAYDQNDIYAQRIGADGALGGVNPNTAETVALSMYPNPAGVSVEFTLPPDGRSWEVAIYDLGGRRLWAQRSDGATTNLRWMGVTTQGRQAPSGLYLVRFASGQRSESRRLAWIR